MPDKHLRCSFCGKSGNEVKKYVSGPSVRICNECVVKSVEILEEDGERIRNQDLQTCPIDMDAVELIDQTGVCDPTDLHEHLRGAVVVGISGAITMINALITSNLPAARRRRLEMIAEEEREAVEIVEKYQPALTRLASLRDERARLEATISAVSSSASS